MSVGTQPSNILDPGNNLTLRPMKYPDLYERYRDAIRNTWTVDEIEFSQDLNDLRTKLTAPERHLIERLVAFVATGDSIVANNLALNLYKHINSPEARLYLSRQIFEEAQHVQFYLTLLDTYLESPEERELAFAAVENIPSIKRKADFSLKWMDSIGQIDRIENDKDARKFLLNLICYCCCIEGLFFFAAFAYVYFLRSKGLLPGLALGTNWVFRDESAHIDFAFDLIDIVRAEKPQLFDKALETDVLQMVREAIDCEMEFSKDILGQGVSGMSASDMQSFLQYVADLRLARLGINFRYGSKNPFAFMELQDVMELAHFFERRVSAYQTGLSGKVKLDSDF